MHSRDDESARSSLDDDVIEIDSTDKKGEEVELFKKPPPKSRKNISQLAKGLNELNLQKIVAIHNDTLLIKLCKNCQDSIFADKEKCTLHNGRICVSFLLCTKCALGNSLAADGGKEARIVYESEFFKLTKVYFGVMIIKLCKHCQKYTNVSQKDDNIRVEMHFCKSCCTNNINNSDIYAKYFPYNSNKVALNR